MANKYKIKDISVGPDKTILLDLSVYKDNDLLEQRKHYFEFKHFRTKESIKDFCEQYAKSILELSGFTPNENDFKGIEGDHAIV